jgi:hypothetical protein
MNLANVAAAARRAQAAYIEDAAQARAAFEALGLTFVSQYQDDSHQAVVSRDADGKAYLSISGTRFGSSLGDLVDDARDLATKDLGSGRLVSAGAFEGMLDLWKWAHSLSPADTVWNVEGHSLGGQRALFTGVFNSLERVGAIHAFEAPKAANAAFWGWQMPALASAVCVVNGADLWFGWPHISDLSHPPRDHIWLHDDAGGFTVVKPEQWPVGLDPDDHAIELVVKRVGNAALAAGGTPTR